MKGKRFVRGSHIALTVTAFIFLTVIAFLIISASKPGVDDNGPMNNMATIPDKTTVTADSNVRLKNEIACSDLDTMWFRDNLPMDTIRDAIMRRNLLTGFDNSAPFFHSITSQRCFDLNGNGLTETLLTINIEDLAEQPTIWNHIVENANAAGIDNGSTLLVFMERTSVNDWGWKILWMDEFDNTLENKELSIADGMQDNAIKTGYYYVRLDGEKIRLSINGQFQDMDAKDMGLGEFTSRESHTGDYYMERYPSLPSDIETGYGATRIWKKEGDKFKFVTDIPSGQNDNLDHYLFSAYTDQNGNDILYLLNTPSDSACTFGLTRLDTSSGELSVPKFVKDYSSCASVPSPDGKRVMVDEMSRVTIYDLPTEKTFTVPGTDLGKGLYLEKNYPADSRANEPVFAWLNNDTFTFDVFRQNDKKEAMYYVETQIWHIDGKGRIVKQQTVHKDPGPLNN
jgi:hypothetical protein